MNEYTEKLLISQYKQFITDHKTIPAMEIIASPHITIAFQKKCYDNALKQFCKISSDRKSLFVLSFKTKCSDLTKSIPEKIILNILHIYYEIHKQSNLSFDLLHSHLQRNKPSKDVFHYLEAVQQKQIQEIEINISVLRQNSVFYKKIDKKADNDFCQLEENLAKPEVLPEKPNCIIS